MAAHPVGEEIVLVDADTGTSHALNPAAAIVWQCFDGVSSLEEIIRDLVEGFGAPEDVVRADVIEMTRAAGRSGLLAGVTEGHPKPFTPTGLAQGEHLRLERPDRKASGAGRRTLIVNWSATCGFCEQLLPEFSALHEHLEARGVDLVLVDVGDADATLAQFQEHGVPAEILSGEDARDVAGAAFPGMGTPVAYLLDEASRVASGLAYGAPNVAELARSIAGDGSGPLPRFLPVAGGVCGPGGSPGPSRDWQRTRGFAVGEYTVGVRAGSPFADRTVAEAFAAHLLPDAAAPENFSVVLADTASGGRRELSLLLSGGNVVARSRSPRRVLTALGSHLSSVLESEPGLIRLDAVAGVLGGRGVLLPKAILSWLERLQAPLARMGFSLSDEPFAQVDMSTGEMVVPAPRISPDESVLRGLTEVRGGASEPGPVAPGRYELRTWMFPVRLGFPGRVSPASAVAGALGTLVGEVADVVDAVEAFTGLTARLEAVAVPTDNPRAFLQVTESWLRDTL